MNKWMNERERKKELHHLRWIEQMDKGIYGDLLNSVCLSCSCASVARVTCMYNVFDRKNTYHPCQQPLHTPFRYWPQFSSTKGRTKKNYIRKDTSSIFTHEDVFLYNSGWSEYISVFLCLSFCHFKSIINRQT